MSCGDHHEVDCSTVLGRLYEYLDNEMPDADCDSFRTHLDECGPCLEKYGLEETVKKLVNRCCGCDDVPGDLRGKVLARIAQLRVEAVADDDGVVTEVVETVETAEIVERPAP